MDIVFQDARIIESGSFDELVRLGGHFAELARTQFMVRDAAPVAPDATAERTTEPATEPAPRTARAAIEQPPKPDPEMATVRNSEATPERTPEQIAR